MNTTSVGRIWVGDLSAYNDGRLVGRWVDIDDEEALEQTYNEMSHGGTQDYFIADTDLEPWARALVERFGEYIPEDVWPKVVAIGEVIVENGLEEPFAAWVDNETRDLDDDLEDQFRDEFLGFYDDLGDYAYQLTEGMRDELPEWVANYVDWDAMGRDYRLGGDVWTADASGGGIYVFGNR